MRLTTLVAGLGALWLVLTCGLVCAATHTALPEQRLPDREPSVVGLETPPSEPGAVVVPGELALQDALALSLRHSPELSAYSWEVRSKEAEVLQAGLRPNPELSIELENFAGSGTWSGTGAAETTITLSQLIELDGKQSKRQALASLKAELSGWDFAAKRLDVLTATAKAFVDVLAAQERLAQAGEFAGLAERIFGTVSARVEAGKVSPVEQTRAQVPLASARIAQSRARFDLEAARKVLAAQWGETTPGFERVVGSLQLVEPVPSQEHLEHLLDGNPDFARGETEVRQRVAQLALERSRAVPDLTVFAGARTFEEGNDHALVAGISVPLPFFDRNQGGIAASQAALGKAREETRAARNRVSAHLATICRDLRGALVEIKTLEKQILPAAEQAFAATDFGYREGKFDFLDVLDAQRTLFEARGQHLEALAAYHQARAEMERLIGAPLDAVIDHNPKEKN